MLRLQIYVTYMPIITKHPKYTLPKVLSDFEEEELEVLRDEVKRLKPIYENATTSDYGALTKEMTHVQLQTNGDNVSS